MQSELLICGARDLGPLFHTSSIGIFACECEEAIPIFVPMLLIVQALGEDQPASAV